jgi:hypothetical protein
MSNYINSVKQSLSRLDDEEIAQKIKSNSLTEDAKVVALEILTERGLDVKNPSTFKSNDESELNSFTDDEGIKQGFRSTNFFLWICTVFLLGISQSVNLPNASQDSVGYVSMKFTNGIVWALFFSIFMGIYSYSKRNAVISKDEILKKYRSNLKSIIIINSIVGTFLIIKFILGYSNFLVMLDILIIFGLTLAIFKRKKVAKLLLVIYAFINPILFALVGASGTSGVLWAFVFLATSQSILIEKTFENLDTSVDG